MFQDFERHDLDGRHALFAGRLPERLAFDAARFEALWALHPEDYHVIHMPGGPVKTPRWQQAFGRDYRYTGRVNAALPVPPLLEPLLAWAREALHGRLNSLLLNWYDGEFGHYIGPHHDSTNDMVPDTPIVTVSLGEERVFRLTHPQTKERRDFPARDGTVFVLPYATNLAWKHQVPRSARSARPTHLGHPAGLRGLTMCGRYTLTARREAVAAAFDLDDFFDLPPRYNIAPTQWVPAVRLDPEGGGREVSAFKWGLIPPWVDEPGIGNRLINARAETVAERPAFRTAFRRRRCLVVADGFFEWVRHEAVDVIV